MGPVANNGKNIASGRHVFLGCCLGIFDLAGGNGPLEYVGNGGLSMAYKVYPVALGFKGSEWGSKLLLFQRLQTCVFLGQIQSVSQVQYLIS